LVVPDRRSDRRRDRVDRRRVAGRRQAPAPRAHQRLPVCVRHRDHLRRGRAAGRGRRARQAPGSRSGAHPRAGGITAYDGGVERSALLGRFNLAVAAVESGGAQATPATDAFLATLNQALDEGAGAAADEALLATLNEALDEGAGAGAYEAIRSMFEGIPPTGFYETIVMSGHALAFG